VCVLVYVYVCVRACVCMCFCVCVSVYESQHSAGPPASCLLHHGSPPAALKDICLRSYVAVRCSVLQCVTLRCSQELDSRKSLQTYCVAVCSNVLQRVAICCSVLQCVGTV